MQGSNHKINKRCFTFTFLPPMVSPEVGKQCRKEREKGMAQRCSLQFAGILLFGICCSWTVMRRGRISASRNQLFLSP